MSRSAQRGPGGSPRRLLTDWTTESGAAGDGLMALVSGDDAVPEAIHLATLGYEVFVLDAETPDDATPPRVHVVAVSAAEAPEAWHERFALVVTFAADDVAALVPCVAAAGLLVVLGDAPVPKLPVAPLAEVRIDVGADPDRGADRGAGGDRFRAVYARL